MSLATVHLLFITVCTVLAVGTGLWGVREWAASSSLPALIYGIGSLICVPALVVYGVRVRRKLKELTA